MYLAAVNFISISNLFYLSLFRKYLSKKVAEKKTSPTPQKKTKVDIQYKCIQIEGNHPEEVPCQGKLISGLTPVSLFSI